MGFGRLLAPDKDAVAPDKVFLAEHPEKQRVLFFIIESTGTLGYFGK